ncbi:MAG: hypothetical protein HPY81_04185 [Firmicutes bacterium]|nr:hypothetical protein [Bacillota bacterium]
MERVERVVCACRGQQPDRVPRGELGIEPGLVPLLLEAAGLTPTGDALVDRVRVMQRLKFDLTGLTPALPRQDTGRVDERGRVIYQDGWGRQVVKVKNQTQVLVPAITETDQIKKWHPPDLALIDLDEIRTWRQQTDFFLFAVVEGGFSAVASLFEFTQFLKLTVTHPVEVVALVREMCQWQSELAKRCVAAGAHGVVVADDLAWQRGTFISPAALRQLVFPSLTRLVEEIKAMGVPVFLHADGDLMDIMDDIVAAGFDGLHSLEPAAGMELVKLKQLFGRKLCLWGNLSGDLLLPGVPLDKVQKATRRTLAQGAPGGGFILGNCTGILSEEMSPAHILAMYDTADQFGIRE